jgi:hypothetical protein
LKKLDSGFRRNDKKWCFSTFYEFIKFDAHAKSPFHMDLGIKVFRDFELSKQVMTAST